MGGGRWNSIGFRFLCFLVLMVGHQIQCSWSLNDEGIVLLKFRAKVHADPFQVFANWNPNDSDSCSWSGVHCAAGKVCGLDLSGLSLEGILSPELGKLTCLRSLVLCKNNFTGIIPEEIGGLTQLELLDLRENNFIGAIPAEMGNLVSLKHLLLSHNKFEGSAPLDIRKLESLSELQLDENLASTVTFGGSPKNRKFGLRFKLGKNSQDGCGDDCWDELASSSEEDIVQTAEPLVNTGRRRLLEQSNNLEAAPASGGSSQQIISFPITRSSGSFPAIPTAKKNASDLPVTPLAPDDPSQTGINPPATSHHPPPNRTSGNKWLYFLIIPIVGILIVAAAGVVLLCKKQGVRTIGPWKTGLSGQLQKAFVTGVPKLNRPELETACEDFSNIIETFDGFTIYKGTLSSGVEIAVASTIVSSFKDWSNNAEKAYRKKIATLSRINHKNFVNLIGYCEDNEPFSRMMVFEYAPNGSLFEHLHVKEMEHLDWNTRTRIIMGTAYCLQYMHHDLNPPVSHSNLNTHNIYLTDDYAAKIGEIMFLPAAKSKANISGDDEKEHSVLPPLSDPESNVYSFGIMMLEIISGKLPYSDEHGPLEKWAAEYLNDKRSISYMIDPSLKSFKNDELDVICEVIQNCIQQDSRHRPTMKDAIAKLREVIPISPDQATPKLSPLWWAELEILSVEAT